MREIRSANRSDEVRITANDELVTGSGQSDIQPFAGAVELTHLVDDQHDGAALEPLEAEHVAIEHLIGVPEGIPIGLVTVLLPLGLLGMAAAGRQ